MVGMAWAGSGYGTAGMDGWAIVYFCKLSIQEHDMNIAIIEVARDLTDTVEWAVPIP